MPRFIQFLPAVHEGDAIGNEAFTLRRIFRTRGAESEILCMEHDAALAGEVLPWHTFHRYDDPESTILLHYALPSPLSDVWRRARGHRVLLYHNITPPHFFQGYDDELVHIALAGRRQLAALATDCDLALADSSFNAAELRSLGFRTPEVLPVAVDLHRYDLPSHPILQHMFRDDFTNFLFVGRISPNKRLEETIRIYGFYKKLVRERCRLLLVGHHAGFRNYYFQLQHLLEKLKLGDVYFLGHVNDRELATCYRLAHLFLTMSDHEGFCVPLVEAMHFSLPILARARGAVADTLNGSGVLVAPDADPRETAELAHLLYQDQALRSRIIARQKIALQRYSPQSFAARTQVLFPDRQDNFNPDQNG